MHIPATQPSSEIAYNGSMKILVIEDDREAADYLQKAFTEAGHTAHVAGDGETGFALADFSLRRGTGEGLCSQKYYRIKAFSQENLQHKIAASGVDLTFATPEGMRIEPQI